MQSPSLALHKKTMTVASDMKMMMIKGKMDVRIHHLPREEGGEGEHLAVHGGMGGIREGHQ